MGTLQPEKICANWRKAMEDLIKGKDAASQLQIQLENPTGDHGPVSAVELGLIISRSFSDSISVLKSPCGSCEVCQTLATTQVGSPSSGDRRSVDSRESSKMPPANDRRGCSKRRRTSNSWTKVLPTMEDGHAWRKYGQKEILNAKFPRCYFRCTHKHDQGCLATRQVQRLQEYPTIMYQTTYFGHHTCRPHSLNHLSQNPLLHSDPVDSYLLSFESNTNVTTDQKEHHDHQYPSRPPSAPLVKKECLVEETAQSNNLSSDLPTVDSNMIWPELMPLESSSASTSSHGFDMDRLMESVFDFESDFPLFVETDSFLAT